MQRAIPLLLLLLLVGAGVVYLLSGDTPAPLDDFDDDGTEMTEEERAKVLLEGDPEAAKRLEAERQARARAKAEADATKRALDRAQPKEFLVGRVVDASNDKPVANAYVWLEDARQPCPRLPQRGALQRTSSEGNQPVHTLMTPMGPGALIGTPHAPRTPQSTERTNEEGRFSMAARGDVDHDQLTGGFDLFVMADGYVAAVVCALPNGRDVEVRLLRGHTVQGTVRNVFNRPVRGAQISAVPDEKTPKQLGHYAWTTTDEQGRYTLTGLKSGALLVNVTHPHHMPKRVGPKDPLDSAQLDIQLVSALRVTFAIETSDTQPPKNASVEWHTTGKPPHSGLQLLRVTGVHDRAEPVRSADGKWKTEPIRIPCDHPEVMFSVKADGHSAWHSGARLVPQEGGEQSIPVVLLPDTSQGRLRVKFETETSEVIPYAKLAASKRIIVRGQQKVEGGLVEQGGAEYQLTALPPGPYSVIFYMRDYAPARIDFDARAGEETVETITLRDVAKLRLRFTADEPMMVGFRILKDNRVVPTYPDDEKAVPLDPNADPNANEAPQAKASDEGTLFTGFGNGDYLIEVTDPKLRAERTRVSLIEGDEVEVEIRVHRR